MTFVEAALLNRSGWDVILLSDVQGSYEEVPSNILDYAIRDRRWVQGNIQHLGLLPSSGIKLMNKLHFLTRCDRVYFFANLVIYVGVKYGWMRNACYE